MVSAAAAAAAAAPAAVSSAASAIVIPPRSATAAAPRRRWNVGELHREGMAVVFDAVQIPDERFGARFRHVDKAVMLANRDCAKIVRRDVGKFLGDAGKHFRRHSVRPALTDIEPDVACGAVVARGFAAIFPVRVPASASALVAVVFTVASPIGATV